MTVIEAARSKAWTVLDRSKLGWWVPIPVNAWLSVCVYSVFVLFCVQIAALRWADPPSKGFYRLFMGLRNWKEANVQQLTVNPWIDSGEFRVRVGTGFIWLRTESVKKILNMVMKFCSKSLQGIAWVAGRLLAFSEGQTKILPVLN
jgi:hypothetical protein